MRTSIQPIQVGQTYTVAQFEATISIVETGSAMRPPVRVHFYDDTGNPIPASAVPMKITDSATIKTAFDALMTVPALAGETLSQLAARAAVGYVETVYGLTLKTVS